jgi:pilus assembly protein Flp/PilA
MIRYPQEAAQGFLEYAMIIVLVAILVMVFILLFGNSVGQMYSNIVSSV